MINRLTITPIVTLIFGLLAFFKIALPDTMTEETMVGVVILGGAALTTIMRIFSGGADENGIKVWYHSKILWTQFGAFLVACLALGGVTITGLDPETFAAAALSVAAGLSLVFSFGKRKELV